MTDEQAVFMSRPFPWAPGMETVQDWTEWVAGNRQIEISSQSPKLTFTSPLFRRRLSQISRMTVQVVHDCIEAIPQAAECPEVFASFRGEIGREGDINTQLIQDKEILPASFSLSVFNTPIALATIALHLTRGYSVVFPAKQDFPAAVSAGIAPLLCGDERNVLFVYADEYVSDCYDSLKSPEGTVKPERGYEPLAFAVMMGLHKDSDCTVQLTVQNIKDVCSTPQHLLSYLLTHTA